MVMDDNVERKYPRKSDAFRFDIKEVETVPAILEDGVVYISDKYGTAIHLCACGCGTKTVMPLKPDWKDGWTIVRTDDMVTFSPSILNQWCGAHYFIEVSRIRWA